jgi:hypothetical protein
MVTKAKKEVFELHMKLTVHTDPIQIIETPTMDKAWHLAGELATKYNVEVNCQTLIKSAMVEVEEIVEGNA